MKMVGKHQTLTLEARCDEMIQYGYVALRQFPKHEKHVLGAEIRVSMLAIQRLIVTALKKFHKKTTLTELDIEIAVLLRRVRLSKDLRYIDTKKYQQWVSFNELKLKFNSKTQVFPIGKKNGRALDFLGYRMYGDHRLLRKSSVKRIKRKISKYRKQYAAGELSVSEVQLKIQSWIGHAGHANSHNLIKSLFNQPFVRSK